MKQNIDNKEYIREIKDVDVVPLDKLLKLNKLNKELNKFVKKDNK